MGFLWIIVMSKTLDEIITEFESLRVSFHNLLKVSPDNKSALLEYQLRFMNLKADLRPFHKRISSEYEKRNDKASTAIKYRICLSIHRGNFVDEDSDFVFEGCSLSQAEKLSASTNVYKKFLEQRAFYKESLVNIIDLREDINSYILVINNQLKFI